MQVTFMSINKVELIGIRLIRTFFNVSKYKARKKCNEKI